MLNLKKCLTYLLAVHTASASVSAAANDIGNVTITVNDAKARIIKGFSISNDGCSVMQMYFTDATHIIVRVKNTKNYDQNATVTVFYA